MLNSAMRFHFPTTRHTSEFIVLLRPISFLDVMRYDSGTRLFIGVRVPAIVSHTQPYAVPSIRCCCVM